MERLRAILRDLLPPLLVRWMRKRPTQPTLARTGGASVHEVSGGPLAGGRLLLDLGSPAYRAMCDGSYDDFVWPALPAAAEVNGAVMDIGAHIGYDTLAFASMYPERKVIAFEPNPVNLERIEANLSLNPELAGRIQVMGVALADSNGDLAFQTSDKVDDETSSGGHLGSIRPPLEEHIYAMAGFKETVVPVRRLDDIAREQAWGRIGLMKIDVEGAEHLVLEGAREILGRDHPVLCIEVHSIGCMLAVDAILGPLGYGITLLHEHRPGRAHIIARVRHS